jgi:hypothetical protein
MPLCSHHLGLGTPTQWTVADDKKPCLYQQLHVHLHTTHDDDKIDFEQTPRHRRLYICTKHLNRLIGSTDLAYYCITTDSLRTQCGDEMTDVVVCCCLLKRKSHGVFAFDQVGLPNWEGERRRSIDVPFGKSPAPRRCQT